MRKYIRIILLLLIPVAIPISGLAQQVSWDVSLWGKRRAFTEHVEKLAELVERKTNGDFVLNLSYGGLSKPKENLDGIASGAFEMAQFCAGYHKEKNPSITVMELPFLGVNTLAEERTISQWLYRHPSVRQDFRKWNAIALMPSPLPQYNLIGSGRAPVSLLQLAGLDVRATGGIGRAMEALGANPSPIVATEVRQALQSGDINAVAFAPHAHMSFGTLANATWWTTNLNPGTVHCPVVASIDAVSKLSNAHRDALYGSINEALDYYIGHYDYNMRESWEPVLDKLNIRKVTFNDSELNNFRERVERPAALEWIQEHEQNGLPARELYSLVKIALTGENPEEKLFAGGVPEQLEWVASQEQKEQAMKEEILANYSFNKKNSPQMPGSSPAMKDTGVVAEAGSAVAPVDLALEQELADVAGVPGAVNGGIAALFVNVPRADEQHNSTMDGANTMPVAETAGLAGNGYFGLPRNSSEKTFDADPLKMLVEWELEGDATVGSTIASLSDYIGYELQTNDQTAIKVYGRKLPRIQQSISGISVGDAFQVLSGRGLVTVFDHTYRTVKHVPIKQSDSNTLAPCPADLDAGVRTGDGVLLLPGGGQCTY